MTAPRNKYEWLERLWILDLSGERLRVLGAIQSAHRDGASLISTAEIVKRTGLSRSAASRNLKAAERQKLVAVEWSRGGSRPHRITLLDPAVAVLDCGSMSAAVEEDGDCGSMAAAVTAAPSRVRVDSTLTLVGGPPAGPPLPETVPTSKVCGRGSTSSPPIVAMGDVGDDIAPIDARLDSSCVDPLSDLDANWDDEEDAPPTYCEKLAELRDLVADLVRYRILLPEALEHFSETDDEPDEGELDRLIELARDAFDEENRRVEAHNAEIDAAQAAVAERQAALPLSERINDPVSRASYVARLSARLLKLPREQRHAAAMGYSSLILEELRETLSRQRADILSQTLTEDVLTAVWRLDRARETASVQASGNVVSLAVIRSKKEHADG